MSATPGALEIRLPFTAALVQQDQLGNLDGSPAHTIGPNVVSTRWPKFILPGIAGFLMTLQIWRWVTAERKTRPGWAGLSGNLAFLCSADRHYLSEGSMKLIGQQPKEVTTRETPALPAA